MTQNHRLSLMVVLLILQTIVFFDIVLGGKKSEAQRCRTLRLRAGSGVLTGYIGIDQYGLTTPRYIHVEY